MNRLKFRLSKTGKQISNVINCFVGINNRGKFILCKNDVNHLLKVSYFLEVLTETDELTSGMETIKLNIVEISFRGFEMKAKNEYPEWLMEILWQHYNLIK